MPSSSSFGDIGATRRPPSTLTVTIPDAAPSQSSSSKYLFVLPSLFVLLAPLFYLYNGLDADYSKGGTQALTACTSAAGAGFVLVFARDTNVLFNVVLFFHVGMEVFVVDRAVRYARDDPSPAWAYVGLVVAALHLLPFFVLATRPRVLLGLATAGVLVNTLLLLLTAPALGGQLLLLVGASSSALLAVTRYLHATETPIPTPWSLLRC